MSANTIDRISGIITTTDATQTILSDYGDLPDDCAFSADITVVARDTSSGDAVVFRKAVGGKKVGSTVSIIGSVLDIITAEKDLSLFLSDCTVIISSGNLQVKVTGIVSTSIEWMAYGIIAIN